MACVEAGLIGVRIALAYTFPPHRFCSVDSSILIITAFLSDEVVQPVCLQIPISMNLWKCNRQDTYIEVVGLRQITRKMYSFSCLMSSFPLESVKSMHVLRLLHKHLVDLWNG